MGFRGLYASVTAMMLAQPIWAADFSDPTWPCVQRKVVELSVGQMFPFVIPPLIGEDAGRAQDISALSQRLALRRFEVEELIPQIDEFAASHQDNAALGALFNATFERITKQRKTIISGIARYAEKQTALSDQIELQRSKMRALNEAETPDYDAMDAVEERLDWDERIYHDRTRALTYVCESPVLLEKRAFAVAKAIQTHWAD